MAKTTRAALHIAFAVLLLLPLASTVAGNINLSPTRIQLSASEPSAVLTLHNQYTEPTIIQLETSAWHQDDSGDNYQPTQNLIATPTVFSLQPGERQLVRVGLRHLTDLDSEQAYRLFIQEVPTTGTSNASVQVVLRFSLPVFVAPTSKHQLQPLVWRLLEYGDQLLIRAENPGTKHIQITRFILYQGSTPVAVQQHMQYLLPGQSHQWKVKATVPVPLGATLTVDATTDAGDMQSTLLPPK